MLSDRLGDAQMTEAVFGDDEEEGAPPARRLRPRVAREVVAALARAIASSRFAERTTLPSEAALCAEFGVSRTVIREALKTLESKGLLRGKPRVGTLVRPKSDWNLLDAELLDWMGADFLDDALLEAILEARETVEPVAAELAASRASPQEIADLHHAVARMRTAGDHLAFTEADVVFHTVLLKASHNPVFAQFSAIIEAGLKRALGASNRAAGPGIEEALAVHQQLVEALRLRDKSAARAASLAILERARRDLPVAG